MEHSWRRTCIWSRRKYTPLAVVILSLTYIMYSVITHKWSKYGSKGTTSWEEYRGSVVAVLECPYRYTPLKKLFPHSISLYQWSDYGSKWKTRGRVILKIGQGHSTVLMLQIILCHIPVLGGWLLLMKDSGGERMHYPYGECILSPTDFDVGSECWDSVCTHIGWRCSWVEVSKVFRN